MSFFAQDTSYWNNKVKNFLHDPPDKALQIPGHERRSNLLLDALGISATLQAEDYRDADRIAAGMDRVVLPGYSSDSQKNGAVDFLKNPVITHPLGSNEALTINLPENLQGEEKSAKIEDISAAMQKLLRDDLGVKADGRGLSEKPGLKADEKAFAPMRFHYLHFLFKKRLAAKDIGGLGVLWPRLPADTRLPDHSIWQHNSLVSALASCSELSPDHQAAIMVFSLTPVQEFIAKSRKLRDFWSGSLILSWLAFEGIKVVISELGADHVLYPSLHDQPMVEDLLGQLGMDDLLEAGKRAASRKSSKNGVASFPNKFVFLAPKGREAEVAEKISSAIKAAWMNLGERTLALIFKKTKKEDPFINTLFAQQMGDYWDFQWAASPLVGKSDKDIVKTLLHKKSWEPAFDLLEKAEKFFRLHEDGRGSLYSVSHALAQGCLAAGKLSRVNHRLPEAGIKCDMFSEYEIIHYHHKTPDDQNP
ncbi:type III-B CRISPR-associated protein Cas10/Cmr2, partial [bacterium]|nr:type III-B CRISPR-associated protein Cas10/Cmr2 [bacterium]